MSGSTLPDIKIFVDCADFPSIEKALALPQTKGFTTNPSLVSQTGITDYASYAAKVLSLAPSVPVSFEVLAEDMEGMEREARIIRSWGANVYVKIPVIDGSGASMGPLIEKLSAEGIPLNVTCVFTKEQAKIAVESLEPGCAAIVSVFAGRIADVGIDPMPFVRECREIIAGLPKAKLLWASTREIFNIWQAADAGCDIITAPLSLVTKLKGVGKTPWELSVEAVKAFMRDTANAGIAPLA